MNEDFWMLYYDPERAGAWVSERLGLHAGMDIHDCKCMMSASIKAIRRKNVSDKQKLFILDRLLAKAQRIKRPNWMMFYKKAYAYRRELTDRMQVIQPRLL